MKTSNNLDTVECPKCGTQIPLSEIMTGKIESDLKLKYETEYREKYKLDEEKLKNKLNKEAEEKYSTEIKALQEEIHDKGSKLRDYLQKEIEIKKKERELSEKEENLMLSFEEKLKKAKSEIELKAKEKALKESAVQIEDLRNEISEKEKRLEVLNKKQLELNKKERLLANKEKELEEGFEEKLKIIKVKIEEETKEKILRDSAVEAEDLKNQLSELKYKLDSSQKNELDLLKKQRELESEKKEFELTKQRELEAARTEIFKTAKLESDSEYQMKLREKEERLSQMTVKIEELKKKAEQGSQQMQGEVQELELEKFLSARFVHDVIAPVPKGFKGADVLQKVKTQFGQECGKIIWESKRTAKWNNDWIIKLKEDQRDSKADIAVIVSQALPDGISNISQIEGVWVVSFEAVYGITIALREQLIQIDQIKKSNVGKSEKMEVVYNYLCSNEFRQKVEGIVEAFTTMRTDLESEKRAINKQWEKREIQIDRVLKNTTGMYAGLQALIGAALPEIKALELPSDESVS